MTHEQPTLPLAAIKLNFNPIPGRVDGRLFDKRLTLILNNFFSTKPIKYLSNFYLESFYKKVFFVIAAILKF